MTDFIHEPKNKPEKETQPAYVPPKSEKERAKRVYLYSVILFGAAFLLIFWSFLANNQQWRDELRNTTTVLQDSMKENAAQEKQISALEARIAELEERLEETQDKQLDTLAALRALDALREIERAAAAGDTDTARSLAEQFEKDGLHGLLPTEPLRDGALSPKASYDALVETLSPEESK